METIEKNCVIYGSAVHPHISKRLFIRGRLVLSPEGMRELKAAPSFVGDECAPPVYRHIPSPTRMAGPLYYTILFTGPEFEEPDLRRENYIDPFLNVEDKETALEK